MVAPTIQSIFLIGYAAFEQMHSLSEFVCQAAHALMVCRTAVLGGHTQSCPDGHFHRIWYNIWYTPDLSRFHRDLSGQASYVPSVCLSPGSAVACQAKGAYSAMRSFPFDLYYPGRTEVFVALQRQSNESNPPHT